MAEHAIRFGVADLSKARRAATWIALIRGQKKDVYVTCRELKGAMKLSLHERGQWHVAFQSPEQFEPDSIPESRFAVKYERAAEIGPGVTLACRIHVPHFAPTVPMVGMEHGVRYLQPAGKGQSVEIAILLMDATQKGRGWPGMNSMGTAPIGRLDWSDGSHVSIISQRVPFAPPDDSKARGTAHYFRGAKAEDLLERGLRALTIGRHVDGSIILQEMPVESVKHTRA